MRWRGGGVDRWWKCDGFCEEEDECVVDGDVTGGWMTWRGGGVDRQWKCESLCEKKEIFS